MYSGTKSTGFSKLVRKFDCLLLALQHSHMMTPVMQAAEVHSASKVGLFTVGCNTLQQVGCNKEGDASRPVTVLPDEAVNTCEINWYM